MSRPSRKRVVPSSFDGFDVDLPSLENKAESSATASDSLHFEEPVGSSGDFLVEPAAQVCLAGDETLALGADGDFEPEPPLVSSTTFSSSSSSSSSSSGPPSSNTPLPAKPQSVVRPPPPKKARKDAAQLNSGPLKYAFCVETPSGSATKQIMSSFDLSSATLSDLESELLAHLEDVAPASDWTYKFQIVSPGL